LWGDTRTEIAGLDEKRRRAGEGALESRGVEFILPRGDAWLSLRPPADTSIYTSIYLGRFADGAAVPLKQPAGAEGLELRIPPDQASVPWRLLIRSQNRITVCGIGGSAS
jgi:hypothetical protein